MAISYFVKIDGVPGESQDRDHRGEIDVVSWSWGLANTPPAAGGGGAGTGRAKPADFTFVHWYDRASPLLARACASGRHLREVTLAARKAGEGQQDFLKVTLKEALVTSVQHQGDEGQISEIVTLGMRQIVSDYRPQNATGGLEPAVSFGWNIASGRVT